ncbi:MAG: hypothetical protein AAFR46_13970 [Pseudomonadota bacterium]
MQIFAEEFGVSDLQGNYSRTYSWMANQLGHMTLGLGTALAAVWAIELCGSVLNDLIDGADAIHPGGGLPVPGPAPRSYVIATVAFSLIVAFAIYMLSPRQKIRGGLLAVRIWGLIAGLGFLLGALLLTLGGLGVPVLSEARLPFLFWFREGGGASPALAALHAQNTLIGLGAAGFSLAIWTVKEFCSDQVTTADLLARAEQHRDASAANSTGAGVRDAMMDESIWDSRTDWFFYLAGAAMAVGIIASHPDAKTGFSESAMELAAVGAFVLLFVILGRVYSYRQQTIDRVGAPYAERLAFLRSGVEWVASSGGAAAPGQDALDRLGAFACAQAKARAADPNTPAPSAHLIVIGPRGAGKTPLMVSLANEAALSSLPAGNPFTVTPTDQRVRARYTLYHRARLDEAADPAHRAWQDKMQSTGTTPDGNVVLVEGRLLYALATSDFAVINDIPRDELRGAPSARLDALIEQLTTPGRRVVWAIDPQSEAAHAETLARGAVDEKAGQSRAGTAPVRVTEDAPAALLRKALLEQAETAGFSLDVAILRTRPSQPDASVETDDPMDEPSGDTPEDSLNAAPEPPQDAPPDAGPGSQPGGGGAGGPARS